MKNIQNLIIFALFALSMVACKKDSDLISPTSVANNKSTTTIITDNHTHTLGRKCASKAHTEQKLQDPIYRASYEKMKAKFERNLKTRTAKARSGCNAPTILPVAIHFQGASVSQKACLISAAKQAVAVLNADFQGTNGDITLWKNNASRFYPGISNGEACLGFEIASKNHPAGSGLSDGELAITINKTNGDESAQWSGYINIFVGDADGSLGYAPLGGSGNGDGMMINQQAFTIGTNCGSVQGNSPNDLGRTLTHEMGHYLNLDHIWGDGGCSADDGVADTPMQAEENYGCPTLGNTKACNGKEALHMNFMDYPDDACMYMFTAGQAARAESWVNSGLLDNLKKDVLGGTTGTNGGDDTNDGDDTDTDGNDDTDDGDDADTDYGDDSDDSDDSEAAEGAITIEVTLDDYGSETTFLIEDADGYVVEEFGPFEDDQAGKIITASLDLSNGVYTFVIFDDYGDGICCDEGNGRWNLSQGGTKIASSDGKFGYWEEYDFAIGNARLKAPAHRKDAKKQSKSRNQVKVVKR